MTRWTVRGFVFGGMVYGLVKAGQYFKDKHNKTEYMLC